MTAKNKKNHGTLKGLCLLLLAGYMVLTPAALASEKAPENTVGFTVTAVLPQNQINHSVTYFDLWMEPEDKQTLQIQVNNHNNKDIYINAQAINASTNVNGIIDYTTPGVQNNTRVHSFEQLAAPTQPRLKVEANSQATLGIEVQMPSKAYDGVVLGGIVITKEIEEPQETPTTLREEKAETTPQSGAAIQNQYAYVIGVKLTMTDTPVKADFNLLSVSPQSLYYRPAIVHTIENSRGVIVKAMTVAVAIKPADGGQEVLTLTKKVDMAPHSVLNLPLWLGDEGLAPGDYVSTLTLTLGQDTWDFTQAFTQPIG